jgi:hypothetical protein
VEDTLVARLYYDDYARAVSQVVSGRNPIPPISLVATHTVLDQPVGLRSDSQLELLAKLVRHNHLFQLLPPL